MLPLFTITLLWSACLLFLLQPVVGKLVLPALGGSPEVWNTCMVFFQALLLAGYAYAHVVSRRLPLVGQGLVHAIVLAVAAVQLPLGIDASALDASAAIPVGGLLWRLATTVGLPFFAVATTAPLLQRWFALTRHSSAADPYFLYVASNLGSLAALGGYPLLVEPWFRLRHQCQAWSIGYALFALLVLACGWMAFRQRQSGEQTAPVEEPRPANPQPPAARARRSPSRQAGSTANITASSTSFTTAGWRDRAWWLALSFVPSSWLLGVTTFITTDIAPVPLLWIVPLAIYLLTYIYAFSRQPLVAPARLARWFPWPVLALVGTILLPQRTGLAAIHLLAFAWGAAACHGALAARRPTAAKLTEFYLWISLGGVLGGVFNALIAPVAFPWLLEYPLAAVAALALLAGDAAPLTKHQRYGRLGALVVLVALLANSLQGAAVERPVWLVQLTAAALVLSALAWVLDRRRAQIALLGLPLLLSPLAPPFAGESLFVGRSFFGIHRVIAKRGDEQVTYHNLVHGGTIHGRQARSPERECEPLTYYHRRGPAGDALTFLPRTTGIRRVGVIGLGSGAMACYCDAKSEFVFFEIDPVVRRAAEDPRLFSYLSHCAQGPCRIVLGDGRVRLAAEPDGAFDLLVLDAFSSDAVPIHLLTLEALELYRRKTSPQGVLLFHVSNRHLELDRVLASAAAEMRLHGVVRRDLEIDPVDFAAGRTLATYVALAADEESLAPLTSQRGWQPLPTHDLPRCWRDDFSSIWSVLRW